MARHTEEEIIARRGVSVVLGGIRKDVPALVIEANEAWQLLLARRVGEEWTSLDVTADWTDLIALVSQSIPLMIELVVAYDAEGHTGGAEWIRSHATPEEVYEAFKGVLGASYPFARDLTRYIPMLVGQVLGRASESSTSSPSPSGASLPTTSDPG